MLGILGMLAAAAAFLVFVVLKGGKADDRYDRCAGASTPERVMENLYEAPEKRDADMRLGTSQPSSREGLEEAPGKNPDRHFEVFFSIFPGDMKV